MRCCNNVLSLYVSTCLYGHFSVQEFLEMRNTMRNARTNILKHTMKARYYNISTIQIIHQYPYVFELLVIQLCVFTTVGQLITYHKSNRLPTEPYHLAVVGALLLDFISVPVQKKSPRLEKLGFTKIKEAMSESVLRIFGKPFYLGPTPTRYLSLYE